MMKKLLALLLATVLVLSLSACNKESEDKKIEEIKEAGVLVVGTSADYPPAEFHMEVDGVDTIVGYDIALAQYIADDLGVELKVVDMAFESLCISLSQGDFDLVLSGMSETPDRAEAIDFTSPYYVGEQLVLVRSEDADSYNTTDDLAGKKVAIQRGTIQEPIAKELFGEENVVALVKNQDVILELQNGKVDVAFIDGIVSMAFAAANPDIVVKDVGIESTTNGQSIGVQKGKDNFKEYLNGIVEKVLEDGTMDQFMAEAQLLAGLE